MTPEPTEPAVVKRRLGRYELIFELGSGGMAEVFLARTVGPADFHRWFAIKCVHPQMAKDQKFIDMFLDEARIAAAIQHPNVVDVFDLGEENGEYFLAMEYLHGEHLGLVSARARKEWGHLPYELAAHIIAKAARGLHHAHKSKSRRGESLNLVHRDVSPQNIFVTYDGQVKMTDFGIAKAAGRLTHTQTGGMKGKVAYMAPEQALGHRVDCRTDLFALGTVLWEVSTGRRLFKAATDAQTLMRITADETTLPSSVRKDYPAALEAIVMRALAREPADRYPSAREMADDLDAFIRDQKRETGPVQVSELMAEVLRDRFAFKERILQADPTALSSPSSAPNSDFDTGDVDVVEPSVSHSKILSKSQPYVLPAKRRWPKTLVTLLVLGAAIAAGAWWTSRPAADASIRVETSPSGAQLELDGQLVDGFTPMTLSEIAPGRHELSVILEGHARLDRTFDAVAGETTRLEYGLSESPATVATPPPQVASSGMTETGDDASTMEPVAMEAGAVEPASEPAATPVAALPSTMMSPTMATMRPRVTSMRVTMTTPRMAAAVETGSLRVVRSPWAMIRFQGREQATPCSFADVPAGRVTFEYRVRGEGPWRSATVRLRGGENLVHRL